MAEGLEVVIRYRGAKYNQVATPTSASSEFAILKRDLAHLRVHSPSQKNVRRVNGSFILHWPMARAGGKVETLSDTLHKRWFKLCNDDPEALKLREFLSIESITLTQDGVLIRSTSGVQQASQDALPGSLAERLSDPLPEIQIVQQPSLAPVATLASVVKPPQPIAAALPAKAPPTAPRLDRQPPPHLKRRMSGAEGPANQTRQKLDVPAGPASSPVRLVHTHVPTSPRADRQRSSSAPGDITKAAFPRPWTRPAQEDATSEPTTPRFAELGELQTSASSPLVREPGEMTPHTPVPGAGASSSPSDNLHSHPHSNGHPGPRPPAPASPRPGSSSLGDEDNFAARRRDRDVSRLTRELWDTRRQLTAIQAREQVILDDLERLGVRSEGHGTSAGSDWNEVSREELSRLEAELKAERGRRIRAERALSNVERECKTPFVVPALFQAFMTISELSN